MAARSLISCTFDPLIDWLGGGSGFGGHLLPAFKYGIVALNGTWHHIRYSHWALLLAAQDYRRLDSPLA